jgi:hypothetical protein
MPSIHIKFLTGKIIKSPQFDYTDTIKQFKLKIIEENNLTGGKILLFKKNAGMDGYFKDDCLCSVLYKITELVLIPQSIDFHSCDIR